MGCVLTKTTVYEQLIEPIFPLFIHRKFTGFSQKPSFLDKLGPFWQNNLKFYKKNDKNACPGPEASLIFPASAPFGRTRGEQL